MGNDSRGQGEQNRDTGEQGQDTREFRLVTRVRLGAEALEVPDESRGRPVFLVTDNLLTTTGVYRKVVDRLGKRVMTFTGVKPNPSTSEIGARVSVYLQSGPGVVVTYGGGLVMGAAKVMHKAALDAGFGAPEGIVVIPTTSESGSEVASFAVAIDGQTYARVPIASSKLVAGLAAPGPKAVVEVPPHITANSGMNVLTHATEAYVALEACDSSDTLAEKAVKLVFGNLGHCYTRGDDLKARPHTHSASYMAAIAFDNVSLGAVHLLVHALDNHYSITHGRSDVLLLPHVIEFNATRNDRAAERYARLSRLLHPSVRGRAAMMSLIRAIERSRSRLDIPPWLSDLKIAFEVLRHDKDDLAAAALTDGYTTITPMAPPSDDLRGILRRIV